MYQFAFYYIIITQNGFYNFVQDILTQHLLSLDIKNK